MARSCSRLSFEQHRGQTRLIASHAELPLVVQRPLRGPDGQAVVVLLTPAGALFGGDDVRLWLDCGPETDVTVTTAAATRVNQGRVAFELRAIVAAGATLRYLPHELIPFRAACYRQQLRVELQGDARALLLDVIGPGRGGEPFAYAQLEFDTQVRLDGHLVVRERCVLADDVSARLAGHTHYGSLLVLDGAADQASGRAAADVTAHTLAAEGAYGSASALPAAGVGVKLLGESAQQVRDRLLRVAGRPAWLEPLLPA